MLISLSTDGDVSQLVAAVQLLVGYGDVSQLAPALELLSETQRHDITLCLDLCVRHSRAAKMFMRVLERTC